MKYIMCDRVRGREVLGIRGWRVGRLFIFLGREATIKVKDKGPETDGKTVLGLLCPSDC